MRQRAYHVLRCLLALTLALALGGCGADPVSPAAPGGNTGGSTGGSGSNAPSGPEILVVYPDGTTAWTSPPPDPSASAAGSLEPLPVVQKLVTSAEIDGSVGGRMQCGRFRLAVPAGAFEGKGTVTMTMEDETVMVVDVEITPVELNQFEIPISLALDTSGADVSTDVVSIYWYDPENKTWVEMSCDKDLSNDPEVQDPLLQTETRGLVTTLSHFSRYSGGKAGW
jgi:hypothetical protein